LKIIFGPFFQFLKTLVSVYDQLGFVLNGCDLVKNDQEIIRDFLAFSDIFIDHHGYYRSRTAQAMFEYYRILYQLKNWLN